jgi:hypothetical protein
VGVTMNGAKYVMAGMARPSGILVVVVDIFFDV